MKIVYYSKLVDDLLEVVYLPRPFFFVNNITRGCCLIGIPQFLLQPAGIYCRYAYNPYTRIHTYLYLRQFLLCLFSSQPRHALFKMALDRSADKL